MPSPKSILQPGDCLLYRPTGFFGWLIAVKTWTKVSHVEVYAGNDTSVASRDGLGVNRYSMRLDGLGYILRPNKPFSLMAGIAWFDGVRGQKYDWLGLLCFTLAVKQGAKDRMFCSEFATRFYRAASLQPFSPETDADHVAPAQFLQSPAFDAVWLNPTP